MPRNRKGKPKMTVGAVERLLKSTCGNVSEVARRFESTREAVYYFIRKYPDLRRVLYETREGLVDDSVSQLARAVKKGTGWAVRYTLDTLGRHRGFVRHMEVSGDTADGSIPITITLPDNGRAPAAPPEPAAEPEPAPETDEVPPGWETPGADVPVEDLRKAHDAILELSRPLHEPAEQARPDGGV